MKLKTSLVALLAFMVISINLLPSFAQSEPYVLSHFYTKGVIDENNPFGGMTMWTVINGQVGTIILSYNQGISVIRLTMTQSDGCEELQNIVCLDSTVTSIKNTQFTKVKDQAKLVFELPHKQTITILSGELETLEIELDLQKVLIKDVSKIVEQQVHNESEDELRKEAWSKLQEALELTNDQRIQNALRDSNMEFGIVEGPYDLIDKRDAEWTSVGKDELTPFMGSLIGSKVSELLREVIEEDKNQTADFVYEEIILTNAYGANVAQTGKTSDYKQWDEQWWILAKNAGVNFVGGFDQSAGVESLDMSVRISDKDGRFMGVMKFVINAERTS